jgi:hypothetical protein
LAHWVVEGIVTLAVIGIIVGALLVTSAVVLAGTSSRPPIGSGDVDPFLVVGISLTGAGVALMASVGPQMLGMMATGIVFLAVGARRMRRRHG